MPARSREVVEIDELGTLHELRNSAESNIVEERLFLYKYNFQKAAESLDISRVQLYVLRKKHGLT